MKAVVGIDTGGTYTDAVLFDLETKTILGTAKALTTKYDLSVGILEALDALPYDLLKSADVISLSTTLATNACVEDKGGSAKLIFFGDDISALDKYGYEYGLPTVNEIYVQESYTTFSGEIPREPDWDLFCANIENGFENLDGVGIVEMNSLKNSGVIEKKAKELFQQRYKIPVVCGHELFNELNCLQRCSSTLLNARLFPVIQEFLNAIKIAVQKRGINADVVIVRSDGSLMSEDFAQLRPIETLFCGPAASAMGSAYLTKEADNIVVDMGGTTTDIALVKNNIPVKAVNGISIGKWRTFVSGLYIKTLGLGGDSAIHYDESRIFLEDYRVVPLCVAAEQYPYIIENLKKLNESTKKHTKYLHEHFMLLKNIEGSERYTEEEKLFCSALKSGPKILREAAANIPGKDIYNLNVSRLLKEGVIIMCGLTPTDIMHIRGDFNKYQTAASVLGAEFVASNLNISVDELCAGVYEEIKRKLYINIVIAMLENKNVHYIKKGVNEEILRFINESYEFAKSGLRLDNKTEGCTADNFYNEALRSAHGKKHDFINMMFSTDFTLTGIGAPVHIFLEDVAGILGAKAVIPKHHEVANALGAIAGSVSASNTVEIKPNYDILGISEYIVFGNSETKSFESLKDAETYAISEAEEGAYAEAVRRGATGGITMSHKISKDEAEAKNCTIYLGTRVIAQAVGSIGL